MVDLRFFKGKTVFLTGHTGFKGAWMSQILINAGATLIGYAAEPPTQPNLFTLCNLATRMNSVIGDIRDMGKLMTVFKAASPEIVIHMAAQPIVRESYRDPVYTYETNVMGTVNILECIRCIGGVKSFLNVTTDKVYYNHEWEWGYRETDPLDGFDPYSNSKSCSELVTHSFKNSFFADGKTAISTARAGNVIGGGDFSCDRIVPDCVRAAMQKQSIIVRNPYSTRPYQHVLEPLFAYLMIVKKQYESPESAGYYNVGPDDCDCVTTGQLVDMFCNAWGEDMSWENRHDGGPHEASFLKLDCSKLKTVFGWHARWNVSTAIEKTVEWTREYLAGHNIEALLSKQIADYLGGA
jgi:CDP-glucose 4,6-dehydratase